MSTDSFEKNWQKARADAQARGLQIVEHGWEQHVVIDEENKLVRRYPRHQTALDKLQDEVLILGHLNERQWPVPIPNLQEFNGTFAAYEYIPGNVLNEDEFPKLTDNQAAAIGSDLGAFLATLHAADPQVAEHKAWRQKGTLLAYYRERIEASKDKSFWREKAMQAFNKLQAMRLETPMNDVVVHGDLHGLNMVLEKDSNHLAGVIDLSEVELGDPHQDFRKLFMTDRRLLVPAIEAYEEAGGKPLNAELVKQWAYVNEWANLCHFTGQTKNATYQRALHNLKLWNQLD